MNYDFLPFIKIDDSITDANIFPLFQKYSVYTSDFLQQELTQMLIGDYRLEGTVSVLPNLLTSRHAIERLMYVQAFMLFDSQMGYYTNRTNLDSYELRFTFSGEGVLEYEEKKYTLKAGEGYFISCKKPHVYYAKPCGWKSSVLHINGSLCQDYFDSFAESGSLKFDNQTFSAFEMMQMQVISATQKIRPYQEYRISCLIDLLLTELLSSTNKPTEAGKNNMDVISRILDYINSNYDKDIVFENLAKEFGVSRTLLFEDFRRCTGFTPGTYLTQLRMKQAKLLLKATDYSIEELSGMVGFHDAGHFSQIFKKEVGTTPLKFRKG